MWYFVGCLAKLREGAYQGGAGGIDHIEDLSYINSFISNFLRFPLKPKRNVSVMVEAGGKLSIILQTPYSPYH